MTGYVISEEALPQLTMEEGARHSISGLSSGAFMAVQLHLAHAADFSGVGVIAGGPLACATSYPGAATTVQDACALSALYVAMTPLTKAASPDPTLLAQTARKLAADGLIDPLDHLSGQQVYIFTGTKDSVVHSVVVQGTRDFYKSLGVKEENILFIDHVPAGHSIITTNPTDLPLDVNQPPYINKGDFIQSHQILEFIYDHQRPGQKAPLKPKQGPAAKNYEPGRLVCFEQKHFLPSPGDWERASLGDYGFAYIPHEIYQGKKAKGVHIALHGCKQGYDYRNIIAGWVNSANEPPYGLRYMTTTGYNDMADEKDLVILYPQARATDDSRLQNPDGCWDWWGYTDRTANALDYYTKKAVQIRAIYAEFQRLRGIS